MVVWEDITLTLKGFCSSKWKKSYLITYFDTFDAEKYADESKIDGEYAELVNKKIEEADKAYEESQKKNYA